LRANWGNWGSIHWRYISFLCSKSAQFTRQFLAHCARVKQGLCCMSLRAAFLRRERANIPAAHLLCYSVQINRPYALSPPLRNCGIQCVRTTFSLATHSPTHPARPGQAGCVPLQIEMTKGRSLEGAHKKDRLSYVCFTIEAGEQKF
jgi:hypothetical protein